VQTLNPNPNSSAQEEAIREDKLQGGIVRRDYRGKTFRNVQFCHGRTFSFGHKVALGVLDFGT